MALGLAVSIRNDWCNSIRTKIDGGSGAGKLRIYSGTRPATGGAPTTLLATLTFADPCAPAAAGGVLTFSPITSDPSAPADGIATWARAEDSEGTFAADMSVSPPSGGGEVQLSTVSIAAGTIVACSSASSTEGNP